jgi:lipopolysaccharide heptosyltransferase I
LSLTGKMRVLIVKLSSIGDVVHTLPAAAFIRRALPTSHIAWVVESRARAVLEDCPAIDELIEIDSRRWRRQMLGSATIADIRASLHLIRGPRDAERIDAAIDFQGLIKSGLVTLASGASRRIGFETRELREAFSRAFLTEQVETYDLKHVIDKNLALARRVAPNNPGAAREADYEFPIMVSHEDELYIREAVESLGERFAILNPGGGWPTKLWAAERFGQVADWLWREHRLKSYVTYGPVEEGLAREVEASSRSRAARPLASTIKQFVALARRAELFVGGDTGPLHLAAAARTPIVGLYGPTSPERNGPFDKLDVTVGRDLWCRAECHRRSCWHWECMDISVEDVIEAVSARLERSRQPRPSSARLQL